MKQEQDSESTQEQQLHELCVEDNKKYFERCDDNCDELHPDRCAHLVQQSRDCQYNVFSRILNDELNTIVGVCYWTKLVDGGHAWLIHPIDCDETVTMERLDDHDVLKAYSHVYKEQMEFDMDLIQFVEHGPSYIKDFQSAEQHLSGAEKVSPWTELPGAQLRELYYSVRSLREPGDTDIKLLLSEIFNHVALLETFMSVDLDESTLLKFRARWLDVILSKRDEAKQTIQQELEELDDDEDYADTVEEINLIIDMLDNIDAEYKDKLGECNNTNEILKVWPPILLPHPHPHVLDYVANKFRETG